MKFTEEKPTKVGFYWAKKNNEITVVEVIDTPKVSMGTTVRIKLLGDDYAYSINNPQITRTILFGEIIEVPRESAKRNR